MTKGRKRNRKKSFWVSDSEWKAIEKIAAETGMGIGEYLRISALGQPGDDYPVTHARNHKNLLIVTDVKTATAPKFNI